MSADGDATPTPMLGSTQQVLAELRRGAASTLTELSELLGLSRPTVAGSVQSLEGLGWVTSVPPDASGSRVGRPATRYAFNRAAGRVLGVDIGAHTIRAVVGTLDGELDAVQQQTITEDASAATRLEMAGEVIDVALSEAGIARKELLSATVGTAGVIDDVGRVTISTVMPGWTGLDLAGEVRDMVRCPVTVETDARLAARAEQWRGAAAGVDRLVYVHAGHRIGSGILIGGEIYRGAHGASGEIGALKQTGWAEALAALHKLTTSSGRSSEEALADGGAGSRRAIAGLSRKMVPGIAALVLVLDPDQIVLGGGLAGLGDALSDPIRKGLEEVCLVVPEVTTSSLGVNGVLIGAVRESIDWVDRHVFGLEPSSGASNGHRGATV